MQLSVTVDFPDDITKGPFDREKLHALMALIRGLGARRVNWVYYGEVDVGNPLQGNVWESHWATYGPQTIVALGEPLRAAVLAAHANGLEIFGILKPYNCGLSGTYPTGSPEAGSKSQLKRIGGTVQQAVPFLESHPEMRIRRRPDGFVTSAHGPIREIRLAKADAAETRLRPEHLRIWVSPDNFKYRLLDWIPNGTRGIETAQSEIRDYHGNLLTAKGSPVQVIRLTGLELHDPFIVITTSFREGPSDFRNTPIGMIEIFGDGPSALPCVVATHAALWIRPRDFRTHGLEYDMGYGHLPITLDEPWLGVRGDPRVHFSGSDEFAQETLFGNGPTGGFVGVALGKNEYLAAAPCEFYSEVQALWLGWVRAMLDTGVDGINLRVSAHGCLSDEPGEYGWNPPVLAAYRQKFGEGPLDVSKLAALRGACYTDFVHNAATLVRSRRKRFQVHLHAEAFRSDALFGQQHGLPANINFEWRRWIDQGWVDEIYLRTSWFEAAEDPLGTKATQRSRLEVVLADSVVQDMLSAAGRRGIPVMMNRYVGRAAGLAEFLDDMSRIWRDGRFEGFDVYEFFDLAQADPVSADLTPRLGRLDGISARRNVLESKASLK